MQCQETDHGGIADRPGNMADIFHTFFGISGLLLMSYFSHILPGYVKDAAADVETDEEVQVFQREMCNIDPTYALPVPVVERLGLYAQRLPNVV